MLTVELASDFDSLCSGWQLACDCSSLSSVLCLCCCYVQRYEVAVAVASILIPSSPAGSGMRLFFPVQPAVRVLLLLLFYSWHSILLCAVQGRIVTLTGPKRPR